MEENYSIQSKTSDRPFDQKSLPQADISNRFKYFIIFLIIVLVLIIGGVGGWILGQAKSVREEKQPMQSLETLPTSSATPSKPVSLATPSISKTKEKRRLLKEKQIKGGRIAAYRLNDNLSDLSGDIYSSSSVFAIVLEVGEYRPEIFSVENPAFFDDSLFEIIGDELWVVNGQTNKIDIYTYELEKREGDNTQQFNSFKYKGSIDLPKYRVGEIYSIKCSEVSCVIATAFHLEAGCTMNLSLATREFSNIKCAGGPMGGEITPEPL